MHLPRPACVALGLLLPALCAARAPESTIPSLSALQRDSVESVSIHLGPVALGMMRFLSHFAGEHDPDSAAAKNVLRGLDEVQIHSFEFAAEHAAPQADLEALRSQITASDWQQVVQVRDRGESGNVDVYCALHDRTITGLLILVAEPREFTVVHIVGAIDVDQIARLRHAFARRGHGRSELALTAPRAQHARGL